MPEDTIRFQDADYDLAGLEALTWDLLDKGAQSGRDPLHSGTMCSLSHGEFPASRTMVLRQVDVPQRLLASYSDVRAPKVAGLQAHPRVSWVFYDARRRIEIRAMGTVQVYSGPGDGFAEALWASLTAGTQHAFSGAQAPGSRLEGHDPASPAFGPTAAEVAAQSAQNFGNFAALLTRVERLEFLYLHHAGHHRARFLYAADRLDDAYWVST